MRRPTLDGPAHKVLFHSPYIDVFMQRCGSIYVLGGSLTLRYKDKENLLINGCPRNGHGDARRAAPRLRWGAADGRINPAADQISRGVQGSCGPLVGGRRIETAGPLVLSVMKEQR